MSERLWRRDLLELGDLKGWLHRDIGQRDKFLLILASLNAPSAVADIKSRASEAGLRLSTRTNISSALTKAKGLAIRTNFGWEITEAGKQHLRNLGVTKLSPAAVQVATDLRVELVKITDTETQTYVEEAIKAYEAELYRSAIVMSWLAAVFVLHRFVVSNQLTAFNSEAKRIDAKWKDAKTTDDLARMGESDFLDRISSISIIGKNVKKELKDCLDRRNGCGHPNSLKVGANTAAHHLEILLFNVFRKF